MLNIKESYENIINNDINNLHKFIFHYSVSERFIHVRDEMNQYFECQTPFLKILKPMHLTFNKKKTIAKKYLILETNDDFDYNNNIGEFMFIINKIHEISQEKIKEKSIEWFKLEFDDIGLDIKIKRPIDQQKENEFIKLSIPNFLEEEILKLEKNTFVSCHIKFKGLKLSSEYINEEWELTEIITQENYDTVQNENLLHNLIDSNSLLFLDNHSNENILNENSIKDSIENILNENILNENRIEDRIEDILDKNSIKDKKDKNSIKDRNKNSITVRKKSKKIIFN
jgi:hypothetical protein